MTNNNWLTLALTAACILLFYLLLKKEPRTPFDEKSLRDSLVTLTKANESLVLFNQALKDQNDSLEKIKTRINIVYKDKLIFIQTANLDELDSIIRSLW